MAKTGKKSGKSGRPPAGARAGERVKDYPQLSIRLPIDVRAKLQALSVISGRAQWRLICDSIECYLLERPAPEQARVQELVKRLAGRKASFRTAGA